jgi:hypothetical protein
LGVEFFGLKRTAQNIKSTLAAGCDSGEAGSGKYALWHVRKAAQDVYISFDSLDIPGFRCMTGHT